LAAGTVLTAGAAQADISGQTTEATTLVSLEFPNMVETSDPATAVNDGALDVDVRVASAGGGALHVVPGAEWGHALRFPTPAETLLGQRAILLVNSKPKDGGPGDGLLADADPGDGESGEGAEAASLSPGDQPFSFGADFNLDPLSDVGGLDNGNNVLQRGLSSDPSQYKLQVERGRASCRVLGDQGELVVKSSAEIQPGIWYRLKCSRHDDDLVLRVRTLDGTVDVRNVVAGRVGAVVAPETTPLAIGGKATWDGKAVKGNSDQFNGVLDNVFLRVSE